MYTKKQSYEVRRRKKKEDNRRRREAKREEKRAEKERREKERQAEEEERRRREERGEEREMEDEERQRKRRKPEEEGGEEVVQEEAVEEVSEEAVEEVPEEAVEEVPEEAVEEVPEEAVEEMPEEAVEEVPEEAVEEVILSKTLQPFLEENRLARHQAKRKLPAQQGTIRGSYNSEGEGNGVCPFCGRELIVELENPASPSNHTSIVTTPTGSLNSLEMNLTPMASSSPWKLKDKDSVFLSLTEKSRSGSSTEYHSAANSLSSIPGQGMTFGQAISSSSSGTCTLVNSSSLIATSKIKWERHITEESTEDNGSAMSATSDQDTAQESNFALPDPTIRMSRGDETNPLENISTYQHEKLRELLQENRAPFSQKYSLVPPDILDEVFE